MNPPQLAFAQPLALLALLAIPLLAPVALRGAERVARGRRIGAVTVRATLLALAILALAGPSVVRRSEQLAVVFLVDASDSVGASGPAAARDFIRGSLARMPRGDTAGIVVFGGNTLVERSVSEDPRLGPLLSKPQTGYSDLAGAVRLGLALFPEGRGRRLVLISDGAENKGDLTAAARAAAASGVEISTVTLAGSSGDEALVSEVRTPGRIREGEAVEVQVTVESTRAQEARLRLFADNDLVYDQPVQLRGGRQSFAIGLGRTGSGFHTFRAEIVAPVDTHWQNNSGSAYTDVKGRPRVLVLEGNPEEGMNIAAALRANGFLLDVVDARRAPGALPEYVPYDAVVLAGAPAEALGPRMGVLQAYVRDLGRGLVIVGGERAYGPGGWAGTPLEETLPVRMEIRNGVVNPPVSLVFVIDKSGSMDASGSGASGGVTKMDLAKEAAFRAIKLLQPQDEVGIVAFDSTAVEVVPRRALRDQPDIVNRLGAIRADGGTDIAVGLEAGVRAQLDSGGRVRHIILVTDGISPNNFGTLLQQMNDNNITLSVIGVGQDVAPYLPDLASAGGGRYYFAADPASLPEIFLQETRLALRSYFVEGDIGPRFGATSPITEGLATIPNLRGYVGTTAKPTAAVALVSEEGDPLLAQWQYGLGRVVAWTSDAKGQWATSWLPWEGFARFWSRAVGWTIAASPQDLQLGTRFEGDRAVVTVDALEPGGGGRNGLAVEGVVVAPDGARREVALRQTAPGRYEVDLGSLVEGAHLLAIVARDGEGRAQAATSGGLVVPYSPEYALTRTDRSALARARELTGGTELTDPAAAFAHTLPPARQAREIWPPLLIAAILLLPFDVALRRLTLGRRDLIAALARAAALGRGAPVEEAPPTERTPSNATMAGLLAARDRMQARWAGDDAPHSGTMPDTAPGAHGDNAPPRTPPATTRPAPPRPADARMSPPRPAAPPPAAAPVPPPSPPVTAPKSGGTLGQLLKAKEEARRKGE